MQVADATWPSYLIYHLIKSQARINSRHNLFLPEFAIFAITSKHRLFAFLAHRPPGGRLECYPFGPRDWSMPADSVFATGAQQITPPTAAQYKLQKALFCRRNAAQMGYHSMFAAAPLARDTLGS